MKTTLVKIRYCLLRPLVLLSLLLLVFVTISWSYMYYNLGRRPDIILPNRTNTIIAITIVSVAVGVSTILFQTISNSRILSPGVLGLENIYLFIQTGIVYLLGTNSYLVSTIPNFLISVVLMVVVSLIVFVPMFFKSSRGVFFVLLLGVVIGQLASAINTYLQLLINPDEFSVVQSKMFASFEFPNMYLSLIASILIGLCILAIPRPSQLDVVHLGRDNAIGLGIDYRVVCIRCLIIVSVLVSVSTVVVGPLMFLGVLVANLSYMVLRTYKHIYLIPMCVLISGVLIVATQYFKTHIYNFGITISVIINFVGGLFFLYLLLISRKKLT